MGIRAYLLVLSAGLAVLVCAGELRAQDDEEAGWTNTAEFSYVLTAGNASASTLGVRNTTDYAWPNASFQFSAGGVRTESETTTRTAVGTVDDYEIIEETRTEVTAESYFLRGRYDRTVIGDAYVFGSAGWERNTFAGFDNRSSLASGVGRNWRPGENRRLKTDLGVTYTIQDDIVEDPGTDDSFAGLRASMDFLQPLTETTRLGSVLVVDENLNETSDLRADWTNSLSVAISSELSLKTTYQILFDNDPALVAVPLEPLGSEQVLTPLEEIDSMFTVSVVVNL